MFINKVIKIEVIETSRKNVCFLPTVEIFYYTVNKFFS